MVLNARVRRHVVLAAAVSLATVGAGAQSKPRPLGPDVASSIAEARVDPAFQTTTLKSIAVMPFANRMDYGEAADIITKRLVQKLIEWRGNDYKFLAPEELVNFFLKEKLEDPFNVFLGDYLDNNSARTDFLTTMRTRLGVDGVLLGKVIEYGSSSGGGLFSSRQYLVGIELGLYRVSDGRRIWLGKDTIVARRAEALPEAAEKIGEVFARFLGRRAQ